MKKDSYLLFRCQSLSNVRQESGVSRPALAIMQTGVLQTQFAIDGQPRFPGIPVFLAVILPPAHRAELHAFWRAQCPASAAQAAKQLLHTPMDAFFRSLMTVPQSPKSNPVDSIQATYPNRTGGGFGPADRISTCYPGRELESTRFKDLKRISRLPLSATGREPLFVPASAPALRSWSPTSRAGGPRTSGKPCRSRPGS